MATTTTSDAPAAHVFLLLFLVLFLFRYLRTFISIWTFITYPATSIRRNPKYRSFKDVTVVIPTTFKNPTELAKCMDNILNCRPCQLIVVTSKANLPSLKLFCQDCAFSEKYVKCLGVKKLNKRKQILEALHHVKTDITCFADDDVFWPNETFLDRMLALFEDPKVGAGGPRQRVRRSNKPNGWWYLGCGYLERRVWNNISQQAIDGSISTLSGRTSLYRTSILRSDEFYHYFQTDSWLGRPLNSDDDKCLTRYVYSTGWAIKIQGDERATIETTLEEDSKFLSQCMRWARAHWRGNFTVMTNNSYWYSRQYFWGLYVIYIAQFFQFAIAMDAALMALLIFGLGRPINESYFEISVLVAWLIGSKLLKMVPHFVRHPGDMKYIPLSLFFSYAHSFVNAYALITLHHTQWGSQKIAGEDEADEYIKLKSYEELEEEETGVVTPEQVTCDTVNEHIVYIDNTVFLHREHDKEKFLPLVQVAEVSADDD